MYGIVSAEFAVKQEDTLSPLFIIVMERILKSIKETKLNFKHI